VVNDKLVLLTIISSLTILSINSINLTATTSSPTTAVPVAPAATLPAACLGLNKAADRQGSAVDAIMEKHRRNLTGSRLIKHLELRMRKEYAVQTNALLQDIIKKFKILAKRQVELKWTLLTGLGKNAHAQNPIYQDTTPLGADLVGLFRVDQNVLWANLDRANQIERTDLQGNNLKFILGLPIRAVKFDFFATRENREIAQRIIAKHQSKLKGKEGGKRSVLDSPLEKELTMELLVLDKLLDNYLADYSRRLADCCNRPGTRGQEEDLATFVQHQQQIVEEFEKGLTDHFPIEFIRWKSKEAVEKYQSDIKSLKARNSNLVPQVIENRLGVMLKSSGVRVGFDPDIATTVITPFKGDFSNPRLPTFVMKHGIGANISHGLSFADLLSSLTGMFNPLAVDLPNSGMGPPIRDISTLTSYLYRLSLWAQTRQKPKQFEGTIPVIGMGRSAGSTYLQFLDFYYPQNAYALRVMSSFSNPLTVRLQLANVLESERQGVYTSLNHDILRFFESITDQFIHDMRSADPVKRKIFQLRQTSSLFVLGEADEDAGPSVFGDQLRYSMEFAPLSVTYQFPDPLKGTKFADPQAMGFLSYKAMLEAKHNLYSQRKNISAKEAAQFFPGLPMELWPKIRNQFHEIMAVTYGMMDLQIALRPAFVELLAKYNLRTDADSQQIATSIRDNIQRIDNLIAYRKWLVNSKNSDGPEISFFDWVAKQTKLTSTDIDQMDSSQFFQAQEMIRVRYIGLPGGKVSLEKTAQTTSPQDYQKQDLTARFARVRQFLAVEQERIVGQLQ